MTVTGVALYANNAQSTLAGDISPTDTAANLASGTGALFPTPAANQFFMLTFVDALTGAVNEIVKVTNVTGDTVTMVRGREGTTAKAWLAGDVAAQFVTAGGLLGFAQGRDLQSQTGNYAVDTGTANAVVIMLATVPPNLTALLGTDVRVTKAGLPNSGPVTVAANGLAPTPLVDFAGNALGAGALPAGCTFVAIYDGVHFVLQSSVSASPPSPTGRTVLTSNLDLYVATTGNNANDGLSPSTPWLTLQHAIAIVYDTLDLAGFNVVIHVADGTYANGVKISGAPPPGCGGPSSILFSGTTSAIVSETGHGMVADQGACFSILGFTVTTSGAGSLVILADHGGSIEFSGTVFSASAAVAQVCALHGGRVQATAAYSITGGCARHWDAAYGGVIEVGSAASTFAITVSGTPAFSTAFGYATALGLIVFESASITFSGGATGTRYLAQLNAVIDVQGNGATYFPGNVGGSAVTGGQYG